jgi:hypothetical protein
MSDDGSSERRLVMILEDPFRTTYQFLLADLEAARLVGGDFASRADAEAYALERRWHILGSLPGDEQTLLSARCPEGGLHDWCRWEPRGGRCWRRCYRCRREETPDHDWAGWRERQGQDMNECRRCGRQETRALNR